MRYNYRTMNIEQKGWLGRLQQRIAAERWGYSFPEIPIERAMTEPLFYSPLDEKPEDKRMSYRVYQWQGEGMPTTRHVATKGRPIRRDGVNILTMSAGSGERIGANDESKQEIVRQKIPILHESRKPVPILDEESFMQDFLVWFRSHPNNRALPGLLGSIIMLGVSVALLVDAVSRHPNP